MVFILFGGTRFYVTTMGNLWNGNIDGIYTFASANGFSLVCIFSWRFRMSRRTSCRQRDFLLCVSSHDISGRTDLQRSRCTSHIQMVFLLCTFSHDISGQSGLQRSRRTSSKVFLLRVSLPDISKCVVTHPAGIDLLSCVYLLMKFQNVLSHILQANGFSPVCIFYSDVSECVLAHPTGKWLFFCVYLRLMFQNVSSHIQQA